MTVSVQEIARMVALQLGLSTVAPGSRMVEDLGAESADVINIIASVEERYGITIQEDELPGISTVADLADLVNERKSS